MNQLLVVFALLVGIASAINYKAEVNERLNDCEQKLLSAIANSYNHGLNYHRKIYEELLVQVHQNQKAIKDMKDDVREEQIHEKVEATIELEILVKSRLGNVNMHETAKTQAIYLAAIKKVSGYNLTKFPARQHLTDVIKIVELESYIAAHPNQTMDPSNPANTLRYSLELQYTSLFHTMTSWNIASFDEFYNLSNRTRMIIANYRQRAMITEAEKTEQLLEQFDDITISLAREWPIDSAQNVEYYFSLSKLHCQMHVSLEILKPIEKTIKEDLLETLSGAEKKLEQAMDKFRERSFNYFVQRLNLTLSQVEIARQDVKRLSDNADRKQAFLLIGKVGTLQEAVEYNIKHPAPEESIKASALYLAAMKFVHNNTDNSPVTSSQIYDQVKKIANKEFHLVAPEMPLAEKLLKFSLDSELQSMYQVLKNLIANHKIPSPVDDENLEKKSLAKILKLYDQKLNEDASKMQISYDFFVSRTKILNSLLPIYSDFRAEQWFLNAQVHYKNAERLEEYLSENFPTHTSSTGNPIKSTTDD